MRVLSVLARSAVLEGIVHAQPVTVAPSSILTYASACSGSVRYTSACSCISITTKVKYICQLQRTMLIIVQTITAPAPLTTVTGTVTVTATTTITTTVAPPPPPPAQAPSYPKSKVALYEYSACSRGVSSIEIIEEDQCSPSSDVRSLEALEFYGNECNPSASNCVLVAYDDATCQRRHNIAVAT